MTPVGGSETPRSPMRLLATNRLNSEMLLGRDVVTGVHGRIPLWRAGGKRRRDQIGRQLTKLGVGLLLHDIGKLSIPSAIVQKQGPLDPDEEALMRTHPAVGLDLLPGNMVGPLAKSVVRSHHERWEGSGYPQGLA